ncbi:hypothetical protein HYFRA_00001876 [Hymenoscyphus fraxineus]|uniref:Beta-galactosidase n=1 Tax=Hymenoscyphus fraxineus TaxID=746836 RepID=A0A9N9PMB7_9HELO|nr:hypothetical protein HYFRA_00001876 [Hymenoscyphus fraxineus]
MRLSSVLALAFLGNALSLGTSHSPSRLHIQMPNDPAKRALLQNIVTWDQHSLFINGERIMFFSGEVHPFRLPVASLYLDVFQKIKAMGFNCVSFYTMWALLEPKQGEFRAEGVFDLVPFFEAASEAGLYLLARPGPYINAEVTGGGYPGWLQRITGRLRTSDADYLAATDNYMANIGKIIAKYQITEGGPIILWQPENEYSRSGYITPFPQKDYMQYVEDQARNAGIVVPFISNDVNPLGYFAPGTGLGEVDIYGYDGYPLRFDCSNPSVWPANFLPTTWRSLHLKQSPNTPNAVVEFQAGSFDPWGGPGFEKCTQLLGYEFERVFYKNLYSAGTTFLNLIFGGTNWGGISYPEGYTSYDYGAAIEEDGRALNREKYSELKLQAQMLKVSPGYLTATPTVNYTNLVYSTTKEIAITPLFAPNGTYGNFYVVRHLDYASQASTNYTIQLSTSVGSLTVPQMGGSLTLNGRDSKVHVSDYFAGINVLYSTAEIFTWKQFDDKAVLIVYGDNGELHEMAFNTTSEPVVVEGEGVEAQLIGGIWVVQCVADSTRKMIQMGTLTVYMLDRNSAYDYWVPDIGPAYGTSYLNPESVIIKAGYLVRNASITEDCLYISADFNTSSSVEVIGAPSRISKLLINGEEQSYPKTEITLPALDLALPDLSGLDWSYVDSLPETKDGYDDSLWVIADHATTPNPVGMPLLTPVSLYGSDYGFHVGALVYRGSFTSTGLESSLYILTRGAWAFASSVFLNGTLIGSFPGEMESEWSNATYSIPALTSGSTYILTVVVDNMGLEEDTPGADDMKIPRGIIDYSLNCPNSTATPISWKLTGNLGGEDYIDQARGPLNEGGFFAERQGYTAPEPPLEVFTPGTPYTGFEGAGVVYYTANFSLALPSEAWDIPLSFVFSNTTDAIGYRALLYVNGWQFGRYVANIGPQTRFPVPEGILNYKGTNWVGLVLWAYGEEGAKLEGFTLEAGTPVLSGRSPVVLVDSPKWRLRDGAY